MRNGGAHLNARGNGQNNVERGRSSCNSSRLLSYNAKMYDLFVRLFRKHLCASRNGRQRNFN